MTRREVNMMDRLLTVEGVANRLGTFQTSGVRFPRRLSERRVRFGRVGRHVRIPESALVEYIERGTVEPVTIRGRVA
jgi:excisionase family DNA binding protein